MFAGQVIGAIDDLPTVKELVERITAEAEEVLAGIGRKVAS
jgi:NAD(P)H-dependent flavin oxidoreductase YrpB (nitropropane dioxygenase family)